MSNEIMLIKNEDDTFSAYDDTYDIVIHCERKMNRRKLLSVCLLTGFRSQKDYRRKTEGIWDV